MQKVSRYWAGPGTYHKVWAKNVARYWARLGIQSLGARSYRNRPPKQKTNTKNMLKFVLTADTNDTSEQTEQQLSPKRNPRRASASVHSVPQQANKKRNKRSGCIVWVHSETSFSPVAKRTSAVWRLLVGVKG